MAHSKSKITFMRRVRAKNDGASIRLVRALKDLVKVLDKRQRDEFTPSEIKLMQGARTLITGRLQLNALAKQIALLPDDVEPGAQLTEALDPKDL
jgi:hypothetical protein